MSTIVDILGRQILDSRGNPTVEVDVLLADGTRGRAAVPSGASTGIHEAWELRDGGDAFMGKGVTKAVANINDQLSADLCGMDAMDQAAVDYRMIEIDGTENKKNLGANAILGVSLAVAHAAARYAELPLFRYLGGPGARLMPAPMMNILNGGEHADNSVDVQEFMVMPLGFDRFSDALRCGCEIFHNLKKVLQSKKLNTNVGDEGGFAPDCGSNAEALELVVEAVEKAGYKPGEQVFIALDVASTELYDTEKKTYRFDGQQLDSAGLVDLLAGWVEKYPICSIEDGCAEDDWDGWKMMNDKFGRPLPTGRRRSVRHQHQATATRHRRGFGQQHSDQGQSDWHAHRNDRSDSTRASQRIYFRIEPSQWRDRRLHNRRLGSSFEYRPD